jgi:hypothetical protein
MQTASPTGGNKSPLRIVSANGLGPALPLADPPPLLAQADVATVIARHRRVGHLVVEVGHLGVELAAALPSRTGLASLSRHSGPIPTTSHIRLQRVGGRVGRRPIPKGRAAPFRRHAAVGMLIPGCGIAPCRFLRADGVPASQESAASPHPVPKTSNYSPHKPPRPNCEGAGQAPYPSPTIACHSRGESSRCTRLCGSAVNRLVGGHVQAPPPDSSSLMRRFLAVPGLRSFAGRPECCSCSS